MTARRVLPWLLVLVASAVVAVPALAVRDKPAPGPDPAVTEWPEWPHRVRCGDLRFDPIVAFSSPTGVEKTNTPQVRAMKKFINVVNDDGEEFVREHDWRLLAEEGGRAEFAAGRLPDEMEFISVERRRGRWDFTGYAEGCEPSSMRRGLAAITWSLSPDQPQLNRSTSSILVYLGPSECSSGKPAAPRLQKPEFREQNGALLMSLWLRPLPPGGYTCQGVSEPPVRIKLPERLGQRRLLDGGTYPPRPPNS